MAAREPEVALTLLYPAVRPGNKGPHEFNWDYFVDTYCRKLKDSYNTGGCTRVEAWKSSGDVHAVLQIEFTNLSTLEKAWREHGPNFASLENSFTDGSPTAIIGPLEKPKLAENTIQSLRTAMVGAGIASVSMDTVALQAAIARTKAGARKYSQLLKEKKLTMSKDGLRWMVGIRFSSGKYLTHETFGFKLNADAEKMKKKQIWELMPVPDADPECVYIKSHINKYLSAFPDGRLTCEADQPSENQRFRVECQLDGRWAIKSVHNHYIGGSSDLLKCFDKVVDESNKFQINLAIHPQVVLQSVLRQEYLHLEKGQMQTADENLPWGADAMITLVFLHEDGRYALMAETGEYVTKDGQLEESITESSKFVIEFFGGMIALRTKEGKYISPFAGKGVLKDQRKVATRDDVWMLEDSHPQIKIKTHNGRRVSIRGGIEVASFFGDAEDPEIFQMEPIENDIWRIKTVNATYFTMTDDGCIMSNYSGELGFNEAFLVEWHGPRIALKALNGNYISVIGNGALKAESETRTEQCMYIYEIVNRPKLVLRGEQGFLGVMPSGAIECNKSYPEIFNMHVSAGMCKISNAAGKFWRVHDDGRLAADGSDPSLFTMELRLNSMLVLKYEGKLLQGQRTGVVGVFGTVEDSSTLWEY